MSKLRQFSQNPAKPKPKPANIVLVDRCHPEKIVEVLTARYFQDFSEFYGYSSPPLDDVRDFTRALISGDIDLGAIPLARQASESKLSKAITEDGKEFALALATIARRHNSPLDLSDELVARLFNRGLLPLYSLAPDQHTIGALSRETGLGIERITEVLVEVEASDQTLRALTLSEMFEEFMEKRLERALTPTRPKENTPTSKSHLTRLNHTAQKTPPIANATDIYSAAQDRLQKIIEASSTLTLDTSRISELIDVRVLGSEPTLPTIDELGGMDPNVDVPVRVEIQPTNMWVDAVDTARTRLLAVAPAGDLLKALEAFPPDEQPTRVFVQLLKARTADIFIESAIANTTARFLSENPIQNDDFLRAVKELESVVNGLDRLHKNSILAIRDIDQFKERLVDTDKHWSKLARNPAIVNKMDLNSGSIDLTDETFYDSDGVVAIAMMFHLPPSLTTQIFANKFGGLVWEIQDKILIKRLNELDELDPNGSKMDQARGWRTRCGTTGNNIVTNDKELGLSFSDKQELAKVLRPVSRRYDPLFVGDGTTMAQDLEEVTQASPEVDFQGTRLAR